MQAADYNSDFSKSILTGLFLGIFATMACLVFAVIYRERTGFDLYLIINWPATIFGCNLILLSFGAVYAFFKMMGRLGEPSFVIFFLVLTALCLWATSKTERSSDAILSSEFRWMLSGYIIILGTCTFLGIPLLFHNKKFMDAVV